MVLLPFCSITTTLTTPQEEERFFTTTTMTMPRKSSSAIFRTPPSKETYFDKRTNAVETCVALGDLVSEVFEFVNDHAFAEIIEEVRSDDEFDEDAAVKHKKTKAILGFIGAVRPKTVPSPLKSSPHQSQNVFDYENKAIRFANINRHEQRDSAPPFVARRGAKISKKRKSVTDNQLGTDSTPKRKPPSPENVHPHDKFFRRSKMFRRRTTNVVLKALRQPDESEGRFVKYDKNRQYNPIDDEDRASFSSLQEVEKEACVRTKYDTESYYSYDPYLYSEDGAETYSFQTVETEEEDGTVESSIVETGNRTGDDAPREDVEIEKPTRDSFPPVIQKFHSLNPIKPTTTSKYNEQCPPRQFQDELTTPYHLKFVDEDEDEYLIPTIPDPKDSIGTRQHEETMTEMIPSTPFLNNNTGHLDGEEASSVSTSEMDLKRMNQFIENRKRIARYRELRRKHLQKVTRKSRTTSPPQSIRVAND